jgi:hypothetical protein
MKDGWEGYFGAGEALEPLLWRTLVRVRGGTWFGSIKSDTRTGGEVGHGRWLPSKEKHVESYGDNFNGSS